MAASKKTTDTEKVYDMTLKQIEMNGKLTNLHTDVTKMDKKLDSFMAESKKDLKDFVTKSEENLKDFIGAADEKYAPKLAWDVLKWAGAVVGTSLLVSLVGLIITTGGGV